MKGDRMKAGITARHRRLADLMLQAEAERAALRLLVDDYTAITQPLDRFYTRAVTFTHRHPLTTTLALSLGGIGLTMLARRLPRLPIGGLTQGTMLAATVLRNLRRKRLS